MKKGITFIVRAQDDVNSLSRCLYSIKRQTCRKFRIIVIGKKRFLKKISKISPKIALHPIAKYSEFPKAFNSELNNIQTTHLCILNNDEVLAPNMLEEILKIDFDICSANISALVGSNFVPRYPVTEELDLVKIMQRGLGLWNNVFKTEFIIKHNLSLEGLTYQAQSMFLLEAFSFTEKVKINSNVLFYRDSLAQKKNWPYDDFVKNEKKLLTIIKRFSKRNQKEIKLQIIRDFVLVHLEVYYNETAFFSHLKQKHRFKKFLEL